MTLIIPVLACYVFSYDTFTVLVSWPRDSYGAHGSGAAALGQWLLWQAIAMLLFATPLLRGIDRAFVLGKVSLRATLGWTLSASMMLGVAALALGVALGPHKKLAALGDLTTQAIQGVQSAHGTWAALAVIAIVIPVVEELLFRGVILQSRSRYISFRWAAVLQAALFAAMHEAVQAVPYVFLLGLLAA